MRLAGALALGAGTSAATGEVLGEPAGDAQGTKESPAEYSEYEMETIEQALSARRRTLEAAPEGKVIESIEIITLDVIEPRDPAPRFLNWFHRTSRAGVIERELLFEKGDRYDQARVDETERNLRSLRQLSVVLIVPVRGSQPDRVELLVITKDVWSLRLNSSFRVTDGKLEFLLVQPSEENLVGSHHTVSTQFILEPDTLAFGGRFFDRRLGGHSLVFLVDANVIFNRESGDPEGSFGSFQYGQPLTSTDTKWGWGTQLAWRREVTRRFIGLLPATFDADATIGDDAIPYEFQSDLLFWQTPVTRSFGASNKTDVTVGLEASRRAFGATAPTGVAPAAVDEFRSEVLPTSDMRMGPYFQLDAHSTRFMRVLNMNTLGLQEDHQTGHRAILKVYPALRDVGSSRDMLGVYSGTSYTMELGTGLVRPYGASNIELAAEDGKTDAQVEAGLRFVTPSLGAGRLVYDGGVLHRYRDYLNRKFTLGGEGRLRGYFTRALIGKDVVASNVEFRTKALQLFTIQFGAVAFWDAGDAFDGFDDLELKHGAGFGLRAAFPQIDRIVARLDFAFPLSSYAATESGGFTFVFTFGQAFQMPELSPLIPVLSGPPG